MSSELASASPYNLSSLRKPMSPLLACSLLGTAYCVRLLLGMRKPRLLKRMPFKRVFQVLGSFTSFRFCRPVRSKPLHILWALASTVILVIYATFMQRSVVVPETQRGELSFDEMVRQNYTFISGDYKFIQTAGTIATETLRQLKERPAERHITAFLKKEVSLGAQIREGFHNESQLGSRLQELRQKNRKVLVEVNMQRRNSEHVMKFMGVNAMKGREPFFAVAYYVRFALPKSFLLLRTLELMKATGHFYHFCRETALEYKITWIRQVSLEMQNAGKRTRKASLDSESTDLTDSILLERT